MKKLLLIITLFVSIAALAQNDKYIAAMQKNLSGFSTAKTAADFESLAAAFIRIGDAEKTQWLPYYWAGMALTRIGWVDEKGDKDALAARITSAIDKADALAKENADKSEILALRNMVTTLQMLVDPQTRYMTYGQQASGYLQKGIQLNPSNPRLYYLQGMSLFNTPEQFGGGKAKAKPLFEKAIELYKIGSTNELYPQWGRSDAEQALAQCQ